MELEAAYAGMFVLRVGLVLGVVECGFILCEVNIVYVDAEMLNDTLAFAATHQKGISGKKTSQDVVRALFARLQRRSQPLRMNNRMTISNQETFSSIGVWKEQRMGIPMHERSKRLRFVNLMVNTLLWRHERMITKGRETPDPKPSSDEGWKCDMRWMFILVVGLVWSAVPSSASERVLCDNSQAEGDGNSGTDQPTISVRHGPGFSLLPEWCDMRSGYYTGSTGCRLDATCMHRTPAQNFVNNFGEGISFYGQRKSSVN
ncbi:hypothetical protein B0H34DRAFT_675814 [Crassisporium funariophilum]|nr:hypothetical protein B0H34DRAFT_675814 [Crassisporium funariophilum]